MAHIPGHFSKDITPEEQKYGVGSAYSPPLGIGGLLPNLFSSLTKVPGFPNPNENLVDRPGGELHPPVRSIMPDISGPRMPYMPLPSPFDKEAPDYQTQFNSFSDTLGGFGKQMGGFGEQMGGFDKQFGGIMDRLSKIEEGIAGLMPQAAGTGAVAAVPYGNNTNQGGIGSIYTGTNSRGY